MCGKIKMTDKDIKNDIVCLKICTFCAGLFWILSLFWRDYAYIAFSITLFIVIFAFDLIFKMEKHIKSLKQTIEFFREEKK